MVFPFGKEGHVWSSVEKSSINIDPASIPLFLDKKKIVQQRVLASIDNPDLYFDICDAVSLDQCSPISDITPIYCNLKKPTLRRIREGLLKKYFTIRVLFIARDPFSRAWLMHRMDIKRKLKRYSERTEHACPENSYKNFMATHLNDYQQVRTRYKKILPRLFDVFAADEIGIFSMKAFF